MDKKRLVRLLILLSVLILIIIGLLFFFYKSKTTTFNDLYVSEEEYNILKLGKVEYQGEAINYIKFNDSTLLNTTDTNELFYSVIKSDEDKYNPVVKYSTKLLSDNIALLGDNISDELINDNKHIKLMIYNNKYYKEYEIVVTTLPLLKIDYNETPENIYNLNNKDGEVIGALSLFDNLTNTHINSNYEMHVRGATSADYPKKGYKISLKDSGSNKRYSNLLNMRNDDDWILYAAYNDQERVRNVISSRIWYDCCASDNQFNVKNGMYYKYVELFFNGSYQGLYALGFPIDVKQLDIQDGEYIFKKDQHYIEKDNYFDEETQVPHYEIKNKTYDEKESQAVLSKYFNTLNTSKDKDELYSIVDIDTLIDFYIYSIFIQNTDGVNKYNSKNLYLSFKKNDDKLVALYTPWDLDQTFGNTWDWEEDNYMDVYGLKKSNNTFKFNMNSIGSLQNLGDKNINKLINDKYKELKENYFNKTYLNQIINEYEQDIFKSGAYKRDTERWKDSTQGDYKDLSTFRKFVSSRLTSLDNVFNK